MDQTSLSPQFTATITALGIVLGTASLLYTISKDKGINAMRTRAVENAKNRLGFWELKLRLQSTALTGSDLKEAKMLTMDAAENIHSELDENLETLRVWTGSPAIIVGLPWWRKLFLLDKPIEGVKWLEYWSRFFYLVAWAVMLRYVGLVIWAYMLFQTEAPDKQAIDRAYMASRDGHAAMISLGFSCLSLLWNGAMFRRSVRHERSIRTFKELERI